MRSNAKTVGDTDGSMATAGVLHRILFLDIDGVMNTTDSALRFPGGRVFTTTAVEALRAIVSLNRCGIVITSTRRRVGMDAMRNLFIRNGLMKQNKNLIGLTSLMSDSDTDDWREDEIEKWIDDHGFRGRFAILDDKPLTGQLRRHLVLTDHDTGLTLPLVDRVGVLLGGPRPG